MQTVAPTLDLPENTCAYEEFNPDTLEPVGDSTYTRLLELGWKRHEFEGKSVLDIGCNSGILSIFAHRLGAVDIKAVDVQEPLVEFFQAVVQQHDLPIGVSQGNFDGLDVDSNRSDIVLFMEVLHWIVDQGGTVEAAVAKLADLTNETLYVETPWDTKEPSIARKGVVTETDYNMELILRELGRHFHDVKVVRFMTYFGYMVDSKRVLIKATNKRSAVLPATIDRANLVGVSIARGANQIELVTSAHGPKVLKALPPSSPLIRLEKPELNALCEFLAEGESPVIVAPEPIGDGFLERQADGRDYMLFPFVGDLGNYLYEQQAHTTTKTPLDLALDLRNQLSHVPDSLLTAVRRASHRLPSMTLENLPPEAGGLLREAGVTDLCRRALGATADYPAELEDALVHSDMQTGNMVIDPSGRVRIVDIDLMRSGTAYSDLLTCAIYNGATSDEVEAAMRSTASAGERSPKQFDVDFSVTTGCLWLLTVFSNGSVIPARQQQKFARGIAAVNDVCGSI